VSAPKIEDHPDHFLVHGKERPYKVFKKGMSKGTVERFQKMCSGGVVKAALGIAVPDPEGGPDMAVDEGAVNPAAFQAGQPENFQADLTPPEPTKYDSRVNASIKTDDGRSIPTNSPSEGIYSLDEQRARAAAGIQPEGDKTQDSLPQGPAVPQMHAVGESRLYREGSKEAQDAARREAQAQAEGERAQAESAAPCPRRNTCACGSSRSPTTAHEPEAVTMRTLPGPPPRAGAASLAAAGLMPYTAQCGGNTISAPGTPPLKPMACSSSAMPEVAAMSVWGCSRLVSPRRKWRDWGVPKKLCR
jgi:hypothetical protein